MRRFRPPCLEREVGDVIDTHDALSTSTGTPPHIARRQIDVEKWRDPKTPTQVHAVIRAGLYIVVLGHERKGSGHFPSGTKEAEGRPAFIDTREIDPRVQFEIGNKYLVAADEVKPLLFLQEVLCRFLIEISLIVIPGGQGRQDIGSIEHPKLKEERRPDEVRVLTAYHALGIQGEPDIEPLERS